MKSNFFKTTTLVLVGVQIVMLVCMYALAWRVGTLESIHHEPKHIKE